MTEQHREIHLACQESEYTQNKEKESLIHIYTLSTERINNNNLVIEVSCIKTIYD